MTEPRERRRPDPSVFLTIQDICNLTGKSLSAIRKEVDAGTIPTIKLGGERLIPVVRWEALLRGDLSKPQPPVSMIRSRKAAAS
jgi:excisionase family DNA binding protein